ncbi:hypothetical protein [Sorangium sp. So ce124]|uniref:hypothetical protein n=1 Tax=Sorangium sp. So ce124 TaxID=3133280 RepID=UPI003F5FB25E
MQFKHHLNVELGGDKETVFLIGERERTMLRGRVYLLLRPLLDGRRTAGELVAALDGEVSKPGGVEPWIGPVFRPGARPCWAGGGRPCVRRFPPDERRQGPPPAQARASALCEAIERYSATY